MNLMTHKMEIEQKEEELTTKLEIQEKREEIK